MTTAIYYTGDTANAGGYGVIDREERDQWGRRLHVVMDDGRSFWLTPAAFTAGPGQRFYYRAGWERQKEERAAAGTRAIEEAARRYRDRATCPRCDGRHHTLEDCPLPPAVGER